VTELSDEDEQGETAVGKTIWGSPAGKKRLADRLVAMLPVHKTYVQPFAGNAAVLFAKEPSEVEVINDADPEIADAARERTRRQALRSPRCAAIPEGRGSSVAAV